MKSFFRNVLVICPALLFLNLASCKSPVEILYPADASAIERNAAQELADYLGRIYTGNRFTVTTADQATGQAPAVLIGSYDLLAGLAQPISGLRKPAPNGFVIGSPEGEPGTIRKFVAGDTPKATLDAVYALLEKLGCGFYLSFDAVPPSRGRVDFTEWDLADDTPFTDRIVFNWHNFLSGCAGWSLPEWTSWIDQSAKMRYSAIMVHAYANNPMVRFEMNGEQRPAGFINTSISGRDWGGQHVNDVRLLPGGRLFDKPTLGSTAALVPDDQRVGAAIDLMQQTFDHARAKGMDVIFAFDFDTETANPQNIVMTLPESARFQAEFRDKTIWLVNPETPDGYLYYKEQVRQLLSDYPQITKLAVWSRRWKTHWTELKQSELPADWQREFARAPKPRPEDMSPSETIWRSIFGHGKVVKAFQQAVRELGRTDIEIMYGTWNFDNMPAAHAFMPKDVTLIPLDWSVIFDQPKARKLCEGIGAERKFIPVVWAHHDDHRYIGRPYTPFPDFADKLKNDYQAQGFGIIHWTTSPLDLYFTSHGRQVWSASLNESLDATLNDFIQRNWASDSPAMREYLRLWITEGPMFGRETGQFFLDAPGKGHNPETFEKASEIIAKAEARLALLRQADRKKIRNRELLEFFEKTETFYIAFFTNRQHFENAYYLMRDKKPDEARAEMSKTDSRQVIELYADAIAKGPLTMGEKALAFSMGTRLWPDYANLEQRLGMSPVRYRFAATQHDPYAQSPGIYTWYIDGNKDIWSVRGEKELADKAAAATDHVTFAEPLDLRLSSLAGDALTAGEYEVVIVCAEGDPLAGIVHTVGSKERGEVSYTQRKAGDKTEYRFTLPLDGRGNHFVRVSPKAETRLYSLTITPKR